jgi:hypothetical protein
MSEADKNIDWSKTTFEGSCREQLRRSAQLPLENILLAIEEMQDLAAQLGSTPAGGSGESAGVKITTGTEIAANAVENEKRKIVTPDVKKSEKP